MAIPLLTAVVSFVFALGVLDQFLERRRPYQLVWTVGLLLYAAASLLQTLWMAGANADAVFRLWYLSGGMLVAAYLGMGSIYLHVPVKIAHGVFGGLLVLTVISGALALAVPLQADLSLLKGEPLASVVPGTPPQRFYPVYVGIVTALLNSVGAFALVASAVYSAVVFVRRHAPGHRVVSNVLIAAGAFLSAAGGTLERFNLPQPHNLALFLGVVLIYLGFMRSQQAFVLFRLPFLRRPRPQAS
ncbi:MAG: hypothetical protein HY685_04400 [Chloroflexi bacterium]|nr:hypothetical protein [Chloroflexota bacterium]